MGLPTYLYRGYKQYYKKMEIFPKFTHFFMLKWDSEIWKKDMWILMWIASFDVICFGESHSIRGPGILTYNTWIWHGYSQKVCIIRILGSSIYRKVVLLEDTHTFHSKPFTLNHQVTLETTTVFHPKKSLPSMRFQTGIGWYCMLLYPCFF